MGRQQKGEESSDADCQRLKPGLIRDGREYTPDPLGLFYRRRPNLSMSFGPTERCLFCKSQYYVDKLRDHVAVCSMKPRNLTVRRTVRIALEANPAASTNRALLVRLVWQIRDAYPTDNPMERLTDPERIIRELRRLRRCPSYAGLPEAADSPF